MTRQKCITLNQDLCSFEPAMISSYEPDHSIMRKQTTTSKINENNVVFRSGTCTMTWGFLFYLFFYMHGEGGGGGTTWYTNTFKGIVHVSTKKSRLCPCIILGKLMILIISASEILSRDQELNDKRIPRNSFCPSGRTHPIIRYIKGYLKINFINYMKDIWNKC